MWIYYVIQTYKIIFITLQLQKKTLSLKGFFLFNTVIFILLYWQILYETFLTSA